MVTLENIIYPMSFKGGKLWGRSLILRSMSFSNDNSQTEIQELDLEASKQTHSKNPFSSIFLLNHAIFLYSNDND